MKKIVLASPIWSDDGVLQTPSLSGGNWGSTLDNLKDGRLSKVARSADATVASTKFTCDLGTDRAVRVLALPKHTISEAGTVRVRGFAGVPVLDSLDFSTGWTTVGTVSKVAAAFPSDDGVLLDHLSDNDAAAAAGWTRNVAYALNGVKVCVFRVAPSDSTSGVVRLIDNTAAADRLRAQIAWSGGVPTVTFSAGSLVSSTALGDGSYRIAVATTSITAANVNNFGVFPAYTLGGDVARTGSMYFGDVLLNPDAADRLVYDTGYQPALPAGTTAEDREGFNALWLDVPDEAQSARYWKVDVNDTTNVAGHVDLARLVIAGAYDPTYNFSYGARLQPVTRTTMEESDGTDDFYDERPQRRELTFSLGHMQQAEAFGQALKLQMRHGLAKQLFVVIDPDDDATLLYQRAFLATLRELSALEYVVADRHAVGYALREVL